jgi:hypothetical protein
MRVSIISEIEVMIFGLEEGEIGVSPPSFSSGHRAVLFSLTT